MSKLKLWTIAGALFAYLVLTLWQQVARREDWPLSGFPMYSKPTEATVVRRSHVGVTSQGEFRLVPDSQGPVDAKGFARVREWIGKDEERRRRFREYLFETARTGGQPLDWQDLHALRLYQETWRIHDGLAGIHEPERGLVEYLFLPPASLTDALEAEAEGNALPPKPVAVEDGDIVIDAGDRGCASHCREVWDEQAAHEKAVELNPRGRQAARLTVRDNFPPGTYRMFVRMKTSARPGTDRLSLKVDGVRPSDGDALGDYRSELPYNAWVWASTAPGKPPFEIVIARDGHHVLELTSKSGRILVDQVWLSRERRELPLFNAPLEHLESAEAP